MLRITASVSGVSSSTAALPHSKPTSAGTNRNRCGVQDTALFCA